MAMVVVIVRVLVVATGMAIVAVMLIVGSNNSR